jgi:hypothetical protein
VKVRLMLLAALVALPLSAAAERYYLPSQFWLNARSGESVTAEPAVASAVQRFLERPRSVLTIHHAREDESLVRAEELRSWLIALGLEAQRISLAEARVAARTADRTLTLEVTENR